MLEEQYQNCEDKTLEDTLIRQLEDLHDKRVNEVGYAADRAREVKNAYESSIDREK